MSKALNRARLFLVFTFFSILGTLAREGSTRLSTYPGTYLSGVVWSNFAACFIMGILTHLTNFWNLIIYDKEVLQDEVEGASVGETYARYTNKKEILLFTGLTTGFCGSFSSFSSLVLELFLYTANIQPNTYSNLKNPAYGLLQFLSVLITQLSLSYAGFKYGKQLILHIEDTYIPSFKFNASVLKLYQIIESIIEVLGFCFIILFIVLSVVKKTWRAWTFSFLFAPFGAYLRWWLSNKLNRPANMSSKIFSLGKIDYLGTFLANSIACLILAILTILTRGKKHELDRVVSGDLNCQALTALNNGFCGALSTVSTFIVEVNTLPHARSTYYVFISLFVAFCVNVLVVGSYNWTLGLHSSTVC